MSVLDNFKFKWYLLNPLLFFSYLLAYIMSVATAEPEAVTASVVKANKDRKRVVARRGGAQVSQSFFTILFTITYKKLLLVFLFQRIPDEVLNDPLLNADMAVLPQNYNFEVHKTVWRVRSLGSKRVALQVQCVTFLCFFNLLFFSEFLWPRKYRNQRFIFR